MAKIFDVFDNSISTDYVTYKCTGGGMAISVTITQAITTLSVGLVWSSLVGSLATCSAVYIEHHSYYFF